MLGLYVHIPFCVEKCVYCDFPSYGGILDRFEASYVPALCREIAAAPYAGEKADTIYFGGGTPSLLKAEEIGQILSALQRQYDVTADAEITVEANPESMDLAYAKALGALGVNRISLGIQSTNDEMLRFLGRVHTADEGQKAVQAVYDSGIHNISVDFMYGLPGQTMAMVEADMAVLRQWPVMHASIYSLIVEEGTKMKRLVDTGAVTLPEEETVEQMGQYIHQAMHDAGFHHYEISSYAKAGCESRHNRKYWEYTPYLGFGAAAHSFDGTTRWANTRSLPQYIRCAGREDVRSEVVPIDAKRAVEDYCFLALRMRQGICGEAFKARFGRSLEDEFGPVLQRLMAQGLLERNGSYWRLTDAGLAYGNYVFSQFIR